MLIIYTDNEMNVTLCNILGVIFLKGFYVVSFTMKNKKIHSVSKPQKPTNLFAKILQDKQRIRNAIIKGESLSTLKDINFVKPI